MSYTSGRDLSHPGLTHRKVGAADGDNNDLQDIIEKTNKLSISNSRRDYWAMVKVVNPVLLTVLAAAVRLYGINKSKQVIWDEAHFGKFGSYYITHQFYFDVHPPLGKLLVGLSGYLANYNGQFDFESGHTFPDDCNFVLMRCFNCFFGILCTPLAYKTALELGFSQWSVWFVSLMVVFEMISLVLSKFILLDSMLLFFTVLCYYCLIKLHNLNISNRLLTWQGFRWLVMTGISIGCVCSVKWVGLFTTVTIGLYIIYDLLIKFYQTASNRLSYKTYLSHWITRIVSLIVVPFIIYLVSFKIHFAVLSHSGPGDGSISTLLQASLEGNTIEYGPRSIAYGSLVTLRSQGLSPNLLHSHPSLYPEGSQQQQVTTYGFKDNNNDFLIEFDLQKGMEGHFATLDPEDNRTEVSSDYTTLIKNGDTIRLIHKDTGCLLHSHAIAAPVSKYQYEVSCYADLDHSDEKDEWVIEVQNHEVSPSPHFQDEDEEEVHPISTNFRLRHKYLGCYLATTGYSLPSWGFQQGEVICKKSYLAKDKNTWWNVENHLNEFLPNITHEYIAPKPRFWKEFILLNYGMLASNNALVPDPDKFDKLSSEWWEWPILHTGLRMCGWSSNETKYFMMGHPFINWFSTLLIGIAIIYLFVVAVLWQRQKLNLSPTNYEWNNVLLTLLLPLAGWFLHYFPFIMMGRVTYLHHYVPALYFAIFLTGGLMESLIVRRCHKYVTAVIYVTFYIIIIGGFWYLRDLVWGMDGPSRDFAHLKVLKSWMV